MKTGKKENPKPLVEKVAEAKPVEDAVGKITEKAPVVTDTAPPPQPKPEEKPVEKKPDPPKPVAENKPKEEPKPMEKKPDQPKVDPIAEALKKEEKKPPPKPEAQAAAPPEPAKPKPERVFDQSKIAALLDKRDPSRQAVTGDTLNSNAALGFDKGKAADNSATWGAMFKEQVQRCWKKPYGGIEAKMVEADFGIKLKKDGSLEAMPVRRRARQRVSSASIRRARCARSSSASRIGCRRRSLRMEILRSRFHQETFSGARAESRKTKSKKFELINTPFRMSRRQRLSGLASHGLLLGRASRVRADPGPVTDGEFAPLPIAIPNFVAGTPADGEVGVGVTQVITNNLKRSGLFAPIDQAAFIEKIINIDAAPQFQNWKTINAQALVTGRMTRQRTGG